VLQPLWPVLPPMARDWMLYTMPGVRFLSTMRRAFERAQEQDYKGIRRGWCLGGETFRQELLAQAHKRTGDSRVAKLKIETEEQNEFNLE